VCEKICKEFKVSEDDCYQHEQYYNKIILQKIQTKYLSHLVSAIEEIINRQMLEENKKKLESVDETLKNVRRYSILLIPGESVGKAKTYTSDFGAAIYYNPKNDIMDLRILIAHELGHVVNEHRGILNSDNFANIFAFLSINEKNEFYKNKSDDFKFSSEMEIISKIFSLCPILDKDQMRISDILKQKQ
jgi:hypothetical protein